MQKILDELKKLYRDESKHSVYQNIPEFMRQQIDISDRLTPTWRDDRCRLKLISEYYSFNQIGSLTDIGANTGYFSLTLAEKYPELKVTAIEGNPNHVAFIRTVCDYAEIENLKVVNHYFEATTHKGEFAAELVLYFNVLHHLGIDHQQSSVNLKNFNREASGCLKNIADNCRQMVFQMGFNWGGNKLTPIIKLDDDLGKMRYLEELITAAGFCIDAFALPFLNPNKDGFSYVCYPHFEAAEDTNYKKILERHEVTQISEFFRRPILFCSIDQAARK